MDHRGGDAVGSEPADGQIAAVSDELFHRLLGAHALVRLGAEFVREKGARRIGVWI
jgi:hypothetical protein